MFASRQFAGGLFEQRPRFLAELPLPFGVKARFAQYLGQRRVDSLNMRPLAARRLSKKYSADDFFTPPTRSC
jgi:hypothetical protein